MKELPELAPYFAGLDVVNTTQLINIASNYVKKASPLIHSEAEPSPDLDNEYIQKIVSAGLLNEKNAEYFLGEVASLIGKGKLTVDQEAKRKPGVTKRPECFAQDAEQTRAFRPSAQVREFIEQETTAPRMYDLLEPGEKRHLNEIGATLRKDIRERIQKRIETNGNELDLTPPDLEPFVQQVNPERCRAGHDAITDIFAWIAHDEMVKTIKDAIHPQRKPEMA